MAAIAAASLYFVVIAGCATPQLSPEYRALRTEILHEMREPYERCMREVDRERYEARYAECVASGEGEGIGGGCEHIAAMALTKRIDDPTPATEDSCDELKLTKEEFFKRLDKDVEERGIKKYR